MPKKHSNQQEEYRKLFSKDDSAEIQKVEDQPSSSPENSKAPQAPPQPIETQSIQRYPTSNGVEAIRSEKLQVPLTTYLKTINLIKLFVQKEEYAEDIHVKRLDAVLRNELIPLVKQRLNQEPSNDDEVQLHHIGQQEETLKHRFGRRTRAIPNLVLPSEKRYSSVPKRYTRENLNLHMNQPLEEVTPGNHGIQWFFWKKGQWNAMRIETSNYIEQQYLNQIPEFSLKSGTVINLRDLIWNKNGEVRSLKREAYRWVWACRQRFEPYSKEVGVQIETEFQKKRPNALIEINGTKYVVDFSTWKQMQSKNMSRVRKVKREIEVISKKK